jgi:hypothetical protein
MRKPKRVLPLIVMLLAAVLAVLIVLPLKSYAKIKIVVGKSSYGGIPACLCRAEPNTCSCVYLEEPTG